MCVKSIWVYLTKEDSILKRINFQRVKIFLVSRIDGFSGSAKSIFLKTKINYKNLNIENRAKNLADYLTTFGRNFVFNLRNIFKKPLRYVTHFGLILIILIVLASGVSAPETPVYVQRAVVDPFGAREAVQPTKSEEVDITELEALAMSMSFLDMELANKLYERIGEEVSDSQVILSGNTIANTSIIKTESSTRVDSKFKEYVIQSGDTLSAIATRFGVSTNSIRWSNAGISNIDSIKPGSTIIIPAVSGVLHTVASGETIDSIASKYRAQGALIVSYNDLYGEGLTVGERILVPNGVREDPVPVAPRSNIASGQAGGRFGSASRIAGTGSFRFPTVIGRGGYYNGWHLWAIDIPNRIGTPIFAADSGRVVVSQYGWNGGYGNMIEINHGNGYQTLYSHMSTLLIRGGYVTRGQVIGFMGNTGRSTGPHLHFEIIRNGVQQNPMNYF